MTGGTDKGDQVTGASESGNMFLSHLRHELRTPLNAILGYSEMLLEDAQEDRELAGGLQEVLLYGKRLLALVNDILDPKRIEASKPDLKLDSIGARICSALRTPLASVIGRTESLLEMADARQYESFIPDLQKIHTAANNLLTFIEEIENLSVAGASGKYFETGIPSATTFTGKREITTSLTNQNVLGYADDVGSLLVVDDNEMNRDLLSRCLKRAGYIVEAVGSGREAISMLRDRKFDLVLLDIMMSEMSGFEVMERLKREDNLRATPVIFISALDDTSGKVRAFKAGGADYITKPFQSEEVLARVENHLKISRLQRALERQNQELIKANEELSEAQKRTDLVFTALAEVLPGTVLDGKYRIEEKIGSGGFGVVYHGTHVLLNRPVAVKVFQPMTGNDSPEGLERFRLEGISASRITHPNAVAVLDSGISSAGIAYIVMELLKGHTLTEELEEKGMLSPARSIEIIKPVCEVLHEAHKSGIIHRDIKPDNIFIHRTREGEVVKLVDFGVAKMLESSVTHALQAMTLPGRIIGTPAYIAPERFSDHPYDGRADIYSLGIVLYQMLSGRVPFQPTDGGAFAIAVMHLTQEPPPLCELNTAVPPELEAIVMNMLRKEPFERPSAGELLNMIRKLHYMDSSATEHGPQQLVSTGTIIVSSEPRGSNDIDQTQEIGSDSGEAESKT
jgi:serine/threonine protein kinase/CheY-like chemotaxis protein